MWNERTRGDTRWSIPSLTKLGVAAVRWIFWVEFRGEEMKVLVHGPVTKRQHSVKSSQLSLDPVSTVPVSPLVFFGSLVLVKL